VTPAPEHLHELATLHRLHVDPQKAERLDRQLAPNLRPTNGRRIRWMLQLTRDEAQRVVRMGPAARHLEPDINRRLARMPEPMLVTAAVDLRVVVRGTRA
jgi:23S rRNA (guanine745-N1)-methyltransferase